MTYIANHCDKCNGYKILREYFFAENSKEDLCEGFEFECIKNICENTDFIEKSEIYTMMGERYDLDALKYSLDNGYDIGIAIGEIFVNNQEKILMPFITENYILTKDDLKLFFEYYSNTVENGLREIKFMNDFVFSDKNKYPNGIMWDSEIFAIASGEEQTINLLIYMYENGCKIDENAFINAIKNKNYDNLKYLCNIKCPGYEKYIKLID